MKEGIIIIGHGSKLNFNKDIMELHAKRMRERGFKNVYIGFNEMSSPSIEETIEKMAADGIDLVIALPLFIASGVHHTKDIPEKIGVPENGTSGSIKVNGRTMKVKYGTPIGDDPKVTDILIDKVNSMK